MTRTATMDLNGGRVVKLSMPNIYKLLTGSGVPNPALAGILRLLDGEGALAAPSETQLLHGARDRLRGLMEIAALCLVEPKLRLDGEPGEGEIGPPDLAFGDYELIYYSFFRSDPLSISPVPDVREPRASEGAVSDGNGIPHPPELVARDN